MGVVSVGYSPEGYFSSEELVRLRRLELPRVLPHSDLNAARLPFRHSRTLRLVAMI